MSRERKKILRVGFINTFDASREYQHSMPPLGIGYLIAYIKKKCWFTEPFFCLSTEELISEKPDIVGISSASENFNEAKEIATKIKSALGIPIFLGGSHISGLPQYLPEYFDIGVIGEGEETIVDVLKLFYTGEPNTTNLEKINGICFRDERGGIRVTAPRPLIKDLDSLPYPDREALRLESWAILPTEQVHLITSRGCPYRCKFCASAKIWQRYREFSSDYVVNEIEFLRERYDPEEIYFFDDLFIASKKRFAEICQKIRERGLHKGVYFKSYARVDLIDEQLAEVFSELNFKYIDFGFESNSERILRYFDKQNASPELNQRAIDILNKYNISVGANLIVGVPIETTEDLQANYKFLEQNIEKIDRISLGPLAALPGTPIWEYAKQRGLVSEDETMNWKRLAFDLQNFNLDSFAYLGEQVSKEEFTEWLKRFQQLAEKVNLRGHIRRLERRLWDKDTKLKATAKELASLKGSRIIRLANSIRLGLQNLRGTKGS
ncbi:MAG: B12-binding domain-containing radical SAM protein [Candidatus Sumerlaeia bacterium]|nr:B12-binding domain-containing radical SAM protein [Candidatus Sumerlaeia bacterium]